MQKRLVFTATCIALTFMQSLQAQLFQIRGEVVSPGSDTYRVIIKSNSRVSYPQIDLQSALITLGTPDIYSSVTRSIAIVIIGPNSILPQGTPTTINRSPCINAAYIRWAVTINNQTSPSIPITFNAGQEYELFRVQFFITNQVYGRVFFRPSLMIFTDLVDCNARAEFRYAINGTNHADQLDSRSFYSGTTDVTDDFRGFINYVPRQLIITTNTIPLPVQLLDINLQQQQNSLTLNWTVDNEERFDRYEIETSTNKTDFTTAVIVPAKRTPGLQLKYSSPIPVTTDGKIFVRLKMIGISPTDIQYSKVLEAETNLNINTRIFPNPAKAGDQINIHFKAERPTTASWSLLDMIGHQVLSGQQQLSIGNNSLHFFLPNVQPGMYILVTTNGGSENATKLVVQ